MSIYRLLRAARSTASRLYLNSSAIAAICFGPEDRFGANGSINFAASKVGTCQDKRCVKLVQGGKSWWNADAHHRHRFFLALEERIEREKERRGKRARESERGRRREREKERKIKRKKGVWWRVVEARSRASKRRTSRVQASN